MAPKETWVVLCTWPHRGSFRQEIVIISFREQIKGKFWILALLSTPILMMETAKTLIKALGPEYSLQIGSIRASTETIFHQSFSSPAFKSDTKNQIQSQMGCLVLFRNKLLLGGKTVQICTIIWLQNLLQMTFQWQLFLSKISVCSRAISLSHAWRCCDVGKLFQGQWTIPYSSQWTQKSLLLLSLPLS